MHKEGNPEIKKSLDKIKELIASLGAMEIALIKLLKKDIGGTAQQVLQEYSDKRREMGYPLSNSEYARLIHQAEQADAEDDRELNR